MPRTTSFQYPALDPRRLIFLSTTILAAVLLSAFRVEAQPSSGGAVQSIGGIAKSSAPAAPMLSKAGEAASVVARPAPSLASEHVELTPSCHFTVDDLTLGCTGSYSCGPETEIPCRANVPGGIDFTAAGIGLRHAAGGTIALRGAPPGSVPVAAWLYWGAIVSPGDLDEVGLIRLDDKVLTGDLVGVMPQPCWKKNSIFAAFRASVHDLVAPGVNGDYRLAIMPGSLHLVTDGRDPWEPVDRSTEARYNGASLVVVYAHQAVDRGAQFFLHEGPHLLAGDLSLRHVLAETSRAAVVGRHLRLGGDGQTHGEGRQPVAPFLTLIGEEEGSWVELRGPTSELDCHPDWQGHDGGPRNQLWDTQITVLSGSALDAVTGVDAYWTYYETQQGPAGGFLYDCVGVVAHALQLH